MEGAEALAHVPGLGARVASAVQMLEPGFFVTSTHGNCSFVLLLIDTLFMQQFLDTEQKNRQSM